MPRCNPSPRALAQLDPDSHETVLLVPEGPEGPICLRVPSGHKLEFPWWSRYEGKAFPGLLVCQNPEAALQTAPDRDSGSDRQRIHRGESVNKFLWSLAVRRNPWGSRLNKKICGGANGAKVKSLVSPFVKGVFKHVHPAAVRRLPFVRILKCFCRRLRIAILVPTVKESTAGSQ